MKQTYDAVIIGSGFGGAIVALRLAQAGQSVAILEQGRRWRPETFPRTVGQVGDAFFRPNGPQGFLEYKTFKKIDVVQGVGVGGGSLHYFNVHARTPARVLSSWPTPLSRTTLDPYYDVVQERLESTPLKPPAGRTLPLRTDGFMRAATAAGKNPRLADIAVYTGVPRKNAMGASQEPCTYCGNCMLGCQSGSKNTLDLTYIAEAEKRYGAAVFPLHKVKAITPATEKNEGYWVDYQRLPASPTASLAWGRVYGKKVIVAAGALGSTEILLRCKSIVGSLPTLSKALGTRFSGNGDFLFAGAMNHPTPVDPAAGPSITSIVDCSTDKFDIHIEDLGFPDPMLWFLEGSLPPSGNRMFSLAQLAARYVKRSLGLSRGSRIGDEIGDFVGGSRVNHFLPYLGMGRDAADGKMRLRNDQIDVQWSHKKSLPMFNEMEKAMGKISRAAGGTHVTSFLWRWPTRKLLTAHPLGGCVMGDSPANSVVSPEGEVWHYPGLYVTDGAILPSALSVNPSLTIAAVAERCASWMIHGRERQAGDAG